MLTFSKGLRNTNIIGCKFQTPKLRGFLNEYGKLELEVTEDFLKLWEPIVKECKEHAENIWNDNPVDGKFRVKVDENTHVFNSNSELIPDILSSGSYICIVEVLSVYNFKEMSGITCRVHQVMCFEQEYLFV